MTAVKKAPRIADDDPVNVNLLAMGFKRAPKTKVKKQPVNRWSIRRGNVGLCLRPNYRGRYVASIVERSTKMAQNIERRVMGPAFDDPYSLAVLFTFEGNGDPIEGALRIDREARHE